jgi:PQQ-dependent dehydrogenase (s-GDH family)
MALSGRSVAWLLAGSLGCAPLPRTPHPAPRAPLSASALAQPTLANCPVAALTASEAAHPLRWSLRVVTSGLDGPWALTFGPDGWLWVTERSGKRVLRVDPRSGERKVALQLDEAVEGSGQDGVLGLALHPQLGRGQDEVYLAYTYDADPGRSLVRHVRIVALRYDARAGLLHAPRVVLDALPGSNDHNSGRLLFGPDQHLYYSIGDQGKNQFDRKCEPNQAQTLPSAEQVRRADWSSYQGKILRIALDGSIPNDNPTLAGVRSHVFSYGHRNAQGLAFGRDGRLFASEHGPKTDDELNLIQPGKNYGWPHVAGDRDDRAYVYANWSAAPHCDQLEYENYVLPAEVPRTRESAWSHPDFTPPLRTLYTVDDAFPFTAVGCELREPSCWPTVAPSSLAFYPARSGGIEAWGDALLVPSLKTGSVFLVRLERPDALRCEPPRELFKTKNRYRDLALGPDGRTFFVVTDGKGFTSGPTKHATQTLEHRGAILEFRVEP